MVVVRLQHHSIICTSMNNVRGMNYGGAGNGDSRTRESTDIYDDEW